MMLLKSVTDSLTELNTTQPWLASSRVAFATKISRSILSLLGNTSFIFMFTEGLGPFQTMNEQYCGQYRAGDTWTGY